MNVVSSILFTIYKEVFSLSKHSNLNVKKCLVWSILILQVLNTFIVLICK